MSEPKSDFLRHLTQRGFIHQCTDLEGLDARLSEGPIALYCGYDLTAPSLHVGSLISIMMLRWAQKTGNTPIVLLGGATTKVGDPSDKDKQRPLLSEDVIASNKAAIEQVFNHFLDFGDEAGAAFMLNNADWIERLGYLDFLREYGPHFTINRMLTFESVKRRLDREQPLTFLEFNYMLMQAVDFLELNRLHGCALQIGGSDQWGNIVNGVELARRIAGAETFGLTTPLLTTASGAKMGKTASGAVWLNETLLSAYDYWQFWRNTEDADVGRALKLFTELPLDEIARLAALEGADINEAKKVLAHEATALLHGREAAQSAADTAHATFEAGGAGADLPRVSVARERLSAGVEVVDLALEAGLAPSKKEARRQIDGGGLRMNGEKILDPAAKASLADLGLDGAIKLSVGKKKHALVHPAD
ncbi:MAG: tyrosine--tRNA ligase [Maricaulaceae bacterium]